MEIKTDQVGRSSCYFDSKVASEDRNAIDLERDVSRWARNAFRRDEGGGLS